MYDKILKIHILVSFNYYESRKRFLLNMAVMDKANSSTIAYLFVDSVKVLGSKFNHDCILLIISEATPNMVKAASAIKVFYPIKLYIYIY